MNPEPITQPLDTRERVREAVSAADDRKAVDLKVLQLEKITDFTDYFLICSGTNERQVQAIVDEVEERLRHRGSKPIRREGRRDGRWVLLDYVDIVVHVQHAEERTYYALERLWKDCPSLPLPADAVAPAERAAGES